MGGLRQHAESELEFENSEFIVPYKEKILELIDIFSEQGHSGGSAPWGSRALTQTITKLLDYKPLGPIMCTDEEWVDTGNGFYQNKRCSAVFKESKNSRPYYLDAIVWRDEHGVGFTSNNVAGYKSRQYIRVPFEPKTFYVDVLSIEIAKDDWEYKIKNPKQLEEVFAYYMAEETVRTVLVEAL